MKTLNDLIAHTPVSDPFFLWLLKVSRVVGGETAVSETIAQLAHKRGVTPRSFAEHLQKRDRGGAL